MIEAAAALWDAPFTRFLILLFVATVAITAIIERGHK